MRDFFWPRIGFRRSLRYTKLRLLRISASPHSIASGMAIGVMVAWTPFIGLHIFIAAALGAILRVSPVAAALGTLFANPLTVPLITASTWEIGRVILGREAVEGGEHIDLASLVEKLEFAQLWGPVFKPMIIGCIAPALLCGVVVYAGVHAAVRRFRATRNALPHGAQAHYRGLE